MKTKAQIRGKRNRQRGAELQRQAVRIAKEFDLEAFNRDRGGAQHEQGDIEIEGKFYGCKRRKRVPSWVLPEKEEHGVVLTHFASCLKWESRIYNGLFFTRKKETSVYNTPFIQGSCKKY